MTTETNHVLHGLDEADTVDPHDLIGQFASAHAAWNESPMENGPRERYRNASAALYGEIARLQAQVAELQALSVTHIMIDVVPGEDGMGEEVFAKSVADVNSLISELSEQASEVETLQAQVDALANELGEVLAWHKHETIPLRQQELASIRRVLSAVGR